jgi:hypothetical protein
MTALRKIKHSLGLAVGATLLIIGLTLLMLFGLAAAAIPAALGILSMELTRAGRWLRHAPVPNPFGGLNPARKVGKGG